MPDASPSASHTDTKHNVTEIIPDDSTPIESNVETSSDPNRPSDEAILSYENQIREAQRQRPLLGDREELTALFSEYDSGSVFAQKLNDLKKTCTHFRRTRPDGNCFYRAFLFGTLERLITARNDVGIDMFIACINGWKDKLLRIGFQDLVFEDAQELLLDLLTSLKQGSVSVEELLVRLGDENVSSHLIMFIRLVASAEIQLRRDHFMPFIAGVTDGLIGVEDFCRRFVECMGEESDHIQLVATASAFEVKIEVAYLDLTTPFGTKGDMVCDLHTFLPDQAPDRIAPDIPSCMVLYRPGHFDIIYRS